MDTRILSAAAAGALLLGLTAQPTHAWSGWSHRELLTFSAPIALPGVVLAAGTYAFELPSAEISGLVSVTSRDDKHVYLTQFTRIVDRPNAASVPRVTFSEAAAGAARPINSWFPQGEHSGLQFVYSN